MSMETLQSGSEVDLGEYLAIVRRRKVWLLIGFALTLAACAIFVRLADPIYTTEAQLVVEAEVEGVSMVETDNPLSPLLALARPDSLTTQLQAMQIGPFLQQAEERVGRKPRAGALGPSVKVENLEGTQIIAVRVTCGDPKFAADYANAIVDLHIEQSQAQALSGIREALRFTEGETRRAQADLESAEHRLLRFRKGHRVEQVTAAEEGRLRQILDLETRARQVGADLASATAEVADIERSLAAEPSRITEVVERDNPRIQQMQDQLKEVTLRHELALIDFKPNSPVVQQLDAQIRQLKQHIAREPPTRKEHSQAPNPARRTLEMRLQERQEEARRLRLEQNRVQAELNTRRQQLPSDLGETEVRLAALTRERDQVQKILSVFTDRLQDLRIREKANRPGARVLLRADAPRRPSFPDPKRLYPVAVVLGLMLGLGCAFLAERLDDRVYSAHDVEQLTHSELLGYVPRLALPSSRLLVQLPTHSEVADSYRMLRSSIAFEALDGPLTSLLVTSAARGEGKSLTCVNLATAMAIDGKRVILIDADLRRPSVHTLLEIERGEGLTDVLSGRARLEDVIRSGQHPNLDVITAGSLPDNPAELLNTPLMSEILIALIAAHRYDLVLIDSSPCAVVTDALLLAGKVDGVLLVVDAGRTHKASLSYARYLLSRARARLVGTVFNRVSGSSGRYYGRYGMNAAAHESGRETRGVALAHAPAGSGGENGHDPDWKHRNRGEGPL